MGPSVAHVTECRRHEVTSFGTLHSLSHEDAAKIVDTHPRLDDVDNNNVRTPVRQ